MQMNPKSWARLSSCTKVYKPFEYKKNIPGAVNKLVVQKGHKGITSCYYCDGNNNNNNDDKACMISCSQQMI